jgi:hypothetical protein
VWDQVFRRFFIAWCGDCSILHKWFVCRSYAGKPHVSHPETAWWCFVVAMWCFVWMMWCASSDPAGA